MAKVHQSQIVGTNNNSSPNQQNNKSMSDNLIKTVFAYAGAANDALTTIVETTASNYQTTRNGKLRPRTSTRKLDANIKSSSKGLSYVSYAINVAQIGYDGIKLAASESNEEFETARVEAADDLTGMGVGMLMGRIHPVLPILQFFVEKAQEDPATQQSILNTLRTKANSPNKSLKDVKMYEEYLNKITPKSTETKRAEIKPGS